MRLFGLAECQVRVESVDVFTLGHGDHVLLGGDLLHTVSHVKRSERGVRVIYQEGRLSEWLALDPVPEDAKVRRVWINGHLCPACGKAAVRDFNKDVPASFWKSDHQTVECKSCGVGLVRNSAYGAGPIASAWKRH